MKLNLAALPPVQRLVAISDTHGMHDKLALPDGDFLIHAGDCTARGTLREFQVFCDWLARQEHPDKILVLGNHDEFSAEEARAWCARYDTIHFLHDSAVSVGGFRIYGSPWTPTFGDWAWMKDRGPALAYTWATIPAPLDILVTHGPPYGHGDRIPLTTGADRREVSTHAGCFQLLRRVMDVQPRVHVFGHIHEGYGQETSDECGTLFVNASTCTRQYVPSNPAQTFELRAVREATP